MVREIGINTPSEKLSLWLKEYTEQISAEYLDDERKRTLASNIMLIAFELHQRDQMSEWDWQMNLRWCEPYIGTPQPAGV